MYSYIYLDQIFNIRAFSKMRFLNFQILREAIKHPPSRHDYIFIPEKINRNSVRSKLSEFDPYASGLPDLARNLRFEKTYVSYRHSSVSLVFFHVRQFFHRWTENQLWIKLVDARRIVLWKTKNVVHELNKKTYVKTYKTNPPQRVNIVGTFFT